MNSIAEVSWEREKEIKAIKALNENFIASLEKMEQSMLILSQSLSNMSNRYEAAMRARECEHILNNIVTRE